MIDTKEFEMLKDKRVKARIQNIAEMLEKKFASMIELNFHNEIGKFKSWWMKFGIYAKNAKSRKLNKEETVDFVIMRKNLNRWLGVCRDDIRKLNTQFRYNGKVVRIPMELLDYVLKTHFNLKALNAGKSINKNEHWTKKYIPDSKHFESVWKKHQKVIADVEQPKVEQNAIIEAPMNTISDEEADELIKDLDL